MFSQKNHKKNDILTGFSEYCIIKIVKGSYYNRIFVDSSVLTSFVAHDIFIVLYISNSV